MGVTSLEEDMVSFLKLVREDSLRHNGNGVHTYTRSDLSSLFRENFKNKGDFSEIFDLVFFNGLMDAESKSTPQFEGYYITDFGIQFLRRPDAFSVRNDEPTDDGLRSHDSKTWTGKRLVLVDAELISRIAGNAHQLRNAVHAIEFQSNSDSQDLKGLADALVAVCEMAEPELSIIDQITSHPKFKTYATLVVFVATIRSALGF